MTDVSDITRWTSRAALHERDPALPVIQQLSNRLHRITAANGQVIATLIGFLGANPRKGVTHDYTDLMDRLVEVAVEALIAVHQVDQINTLRVGAGGALVSKLTRVADRAGVAPAPTAGDPLDGAWACLLAVSTWVDGGNSHRDLEAQLWGRVSKLAEEIGEASDALLAIGSPYQHGQFAQLSEELLDIAVAALGAAEHIIGNTGSVRDILIAVTAARCGLRPSGAVIAPR